MKQNEASIPDTKIAQTAKRIVVNCFRNTDLENIHAGIVPVTHAGDYADVRGIDADGVERSWLECSHVDDARMKKLMQDCVSRVYTLLKYMGDAEVQGLMRRYDGSIANWDRPKLSADLLGADLFARLNKTG